MEIYIYMGRLKKYSYEEDARYANSLVFIYRRKWVILCNTFRYNTGKKKTLIITSELRPSLDNVYTMHHISNEYRDPLIIIY